MTYVVSSCRRRFDSRHTCQCPCCKPHLSSWLCCIVRVRRRATISISAVMSTIAGSPNTTNFQPLYLAPSVGMFEEVFRKLTCDGSAVLSGSIAAGLSTTYNAAVQAVRLVEACIVCVDSHSIVVPIAHLTLAAARHPAQGATLEECGYPGQNVA